MEEVLAAHRTCGVRVVGVHDQLKGEVPIGFVVLKSGVQRDERELVRELWRARARAESVRWRSSSSRHCRKVAEDAVRQDPAGHDSHRSPTGSSTRRRPPSRSSRARRNDTLAVASRVRAQALACCQRVPTLLRAEGVPVECASAIPSGWCAIRSDLHTSARSMRRRVCERACAALRVARFLGDWPSIGSGAGCTLCLARR